MSTGYFYRLQTAKPADVRRLAEQILQFPCRQTYATSLWDVTELPTLSKITGCDTAEQIVLAGDFGHLFDARAELRWKRCDDGSYDVLVLSERKLDPPGATLLAADWIAHEQNVISQGGRRADTSVVLYHAPNGAAQLLRYKEVPR
jgi:hypothetical protein